MSLLNGVELYSTQIGPDKPNLQFDASIIGNKQSDYTEGKNRAAMLYGSMLNAAVTRQDSLQAKNEYLKLIEQDLKRVGKVDWSIDSNVKAASKLFQGMLSNKSLQKDILWTNDFNRELQRSESYRNCADPAKCGGQYWEEGVRYMQYKRMEFQNADPASMLSMEAPKFVPYNSVMVDAMKQLKDSGLSVEFDAIENGYVVTTKNGDELKSPLTLLFNSTLGKDPKFTEMFKTKAYVDRKDWVYGKMSSGEFETEEEANFQYLKGISDVNRNRIDKLSSQLQVDRGYLDQKIQALLSEFNNGGFQKGSDKYKYLVSLNDLKNSSDNADQYLNQLRELSNTGNVGALNVLVENTDMQNAFGLFDSEISNAVNVLAFSDFKQTLKPDEYSKMAYDHKLKLDIMAKQFSYDVQLENIEAANSMSLAKFKTSADIEASTKNDFVSNSDYIEANQKAQVPFQDVMIELLKSDKNPNPTLVDLNAYKESNPVGFKALTKKAANDLKERKRKANELFFKSKAALNNSNQLVPFPENLTLSDASSTSLQQRLNVSSKGELLNNLINQYISENNISVNGDQLTKAENYMLKNPSSTISEAFYNALKK